MKSKVIGGQHPDAADGRLCIENEINSHYEETQPSVLVESYELTSVKRVLAEGWLHKKGSGLDLLQRTEWKVRWAKLALTEMKDHEIEIPTLLVYWYPFSNKPSIYIPLDTSKVLAADNEEESKHRHCFTISQVENLKVNYREENNEKKSEEFTRTFSAPFKERNEWVHAINVAISIFEKKKAKKKIERIRAQLPPSPPRSSVPKNPINHTSATCKTPRYLLPSLEDSIKAVANLDVDGLCAAPTGGLVAHKVAPLKTRMDSAYPSMNKSKVLQKHDAREDNLFDNDRFRSVIDESNQKEMKDFVSKMDELSIEKYGKSTTNLISGKENPPNNIMKQPIKQRLSKNSSYPQPKKKSVNLHSNRSTSVKISEKNLTKASSQIINTPIENPDKEDIKLCKVSSYAYNHRKENGIKVVSPSIVAGLSRRVQSLPVKKVSKLHKVSNITQAPLLND